MAFSDPPTSSASAGPLKGAGTAPLAFELGGDLPCVRCRYNLKGLTIRGTCPECGLPMRATLLAVIDPRASELQPIFHPWLTSVGVAAWALAAVAAALLAAGECVVSVFMPASPWLAANSGLRLLVPMLVAVSGLGALAVIKPHDRMPRSGQIMAWVGVSLYLPLVALLIVKAHVPMPQPRPGEWSIAASGDFAGLLNVGVDLLLIAMLILLRPNLRILSARCLLMRQGMVDRQTMRAVASVLGLCVAGHLMGVLGTSLGSFGMIFMIGGILSGIGTIFFLIGLVGISIDALRMSRVITSPPLSMIELLSPSRSPTSERPSRGWAQ
jgi:hypothetical protein